MELADFLQAGTQIKRWLKFFWVVMVSKFYFAINTSQRKLYKDWKITNLLNLNINLGEKRKTKKKLKQTNKQTG